MKKILLFLLLIPSLAFSQGTPISGMLEFLGNPKDGYIPFQFGSTNRKVKASLLAQDKIDSISIGFGTSYDTIYFWKMGVKQFPGKLTRGSASTWGTLSGSLSAQSDLQNALNAKQGTLISGTNIKTVNGQALTGSGNLAISGSGPVDGSPTSGSTNPVASGGVYTEFQKPLYNKYLGGGLQVDSGSSGPNGDTALHRTFVDNSSIVWTYTSDRKGIQGTVVGGGSGGASLTSPNSFSSSGTQSITRTTTDGAALDIIDMSGDHITLGSDVFGNQTIATSGRMNLTSANQTYITAPNGIGFVNTTFLQPIAGNTTGTGTQRSSQDNIWQARMWNGSSSVIQNAGFKLVANGGVNGDATFWLKVNGTGEDLFAASNAIGVNTQTRKVYIDNLNTGTGGDAVGIVGQDGELKKGYRYYGTDYATAGNAGTYVIPDNVGYVGVYTLDGNTASTSVTLPNPASYPQRKITIRNGSGSTIALNTYTIFVKNGSSAVSSILDDKEFEMKSDGTRWIRVGGN